MGVAQNDVGFGAEYAGQECKLMFGQRAFAADIGNDGRDGSADLRSWRLFRMSLFQRLADQARALLERQIRDRARRELCALGAATVLFETLLLVANLFIWSPFAPALVVGRVGTIVAGLGAVAAGRLRLFRTRDREMAFGLLVVVMGVATVGQITGGGAGGLGLTIVLSVVGASVLLSWNGRWQALVNLAAISFVAAAQGFSFYPPESGWSHLWITVLAAIGLSQANTANPWRYRRTAFGRAARLPKGGWAPSAGAASRWLVNSSLEGLFSTLSEDGAICSLSPWAVTALGHTPEEIAGIRVDDLIHPDDLQRAREAFVHALQTPYEATFLEFRFRHKDGSWRELETALQVTHDVFWNKRVLVFARDVTERRQAERKLAESEARFREIFATSLDVILIVRMRDQRIIDANPAFTQLSGFTTDQARGWTPLQLNLWANLGHREAFYAELDSKGFVHNLEILVRSKNGARVPVLCSAVKTQCDGEPCLIVFVHDIAHLKRVEAELRAGEAKFRQVFDSSLDAIIVADFDHGKFVAVNEEFLRAAGVTRNEVLGRTAQELGIWVNPRERTLFARALRIHGCVRNFEATFKGKDGVAAVHLLNARVVELDGVRHVILVSREVSQLKRVERELIEAREHALAASKAKSDFLSSMSHEIRTPLNAILGTTELLGESALSIEQRRYLSVLRANGSALLDLINGVLELAKIESRHLSLARVDVDLAELVDTVMRALALRAHEKNLELVGHIAPDTPLHLLGDPSRLRQVLTNLIGNAIKFTEHGEIVLSVEPEQITEADTVLRFSVKDTGIGIPADKLDDIFCAFTQGHLSSASKYDGSGLGLAISKHLVEAMGGRIWASSEPGEGSAFYFTAKFELQAPASEAEASAAPVVKREAKVLLAGSSSSSASAISEKLSSLGVKGEVVADSEQVLRRLTSEAGRGEPYLLVLLDAQQMGNAAFELAGQIKKKLGASQRVVIMLASHSLADDLSKARDLGVDACLVKPLSASELADAVRAALNGTKPAPAPAPKLALPSCNGVQPMRILLAEDSNDNRLVIEAFLRDTAHQVDVAEDGATAVKRFKKGNYDLVLMDMQMPVMDGYTATQIIRKWERDQGRPPCRILALTAHALRNETEKSLAAGCDAYLTKPISKATLRQVVNEAAAQLKEAHKLSPRSSMAFDKTPDRDRI